MNIGKKILLVVGTWMGLGAMVGAWAAHEKNVEWNTRPEIEVTGGNSGNGFVLNVRGKDRDITGLDVEMMLQRSRETKVVPGEPEKWTGEPCWEGEENPVSGGAIVGDAVKFNINEDRIVNTCDVRVVLGGQSYPYTYDAMLMPTVVGEKPGWPTITVTPKKTGPGRYLLTVEGLARGYKWRVGVERESGARRLGGGRSLGRGRFEYDIDSSGMPRGSLANVNVQLTRSDGEVENYSFIDLFGP
ncbi:hypothetical protein HZC35_03485 [Candidatus Saganbacteria bacterium]|nr:hypothetical protein [Candidatus Saganbacteria bacterium]